MLLVIAILIWLGGLCSIHSATSLVPFGIDAFIQAIAIRLINYWLGILTLSVGDSSQGIVYLSSKLRQPFSEPDGLLFGSI